MSERDYPVGHPKAADYNGQVYKPSTAPFGEDYGPNHPARGGKNIGALDTPDGTHDRTVREWEQNVELTAQSMPQAEPATPAQDTAQPAQHSTTITITGEVL